MKLVSECHYFPSSIFYIALNRVSHIIFDQYDGFTKMSFRNRTLLAGSNGTIILSVPLEKGRNQKKPMKDIRISNRDKWQLQHWKTITSCYNRSPWFEFYSDELARLYGRPFIFLLDWNLLCFEWSIQKLGLKLEPSLSTSYHKSYLPDEYTDWRDKVLPKNYLDFRPIRYRQVFEERTGFLPNLSILDLLFCEGKNALKLLESASFF
jgi:WbqC-like protein family